MSSSSSSVLFLPARSNCSPSCDGIHHNPVSMAAAAAAPLPSVHPSTRPADPTTAAQDLLFGRFQNAASVPAKTVARCFSSFQSPQERPQSSRTYGLRQNHNVLCKRGASRVLVISKLIDDVYQNTWRSAHGSDNHIHTDDLLPRSAVNLHIPHHIVHPECRRRPSRSKLGAMRRQEEEEEEGAALEQGYAVAASCVPLSLGMSE